MSSTRSPVAFYQFLGSHSLLIGLLPFYLPVYLWGEGYRLAQLCLLIGISGFSFCAALTAWQYIARRTSVTRLMCVSFVLELVLVACAVFLSPGIAGIVLLGVANGLYNGFFWTTQRTLFLDMLGDNNSGRQYGNFQIFVTLFLKIGILLGGVLLDMHGIIWILAVSAVVSLVSMVWFVYREKRAATGDTGEGAGRINKRAPLVTQQRIGIIESLRFTDQLGSRRIFIVDGLFLFLESHFWTLSLFFIASQDFAKFGVIVVVLALVFAGIFYILKNSIDKIAGSVVFKLAVALYAVSWFTRPLVDSTESPQLLLALLVMITFCSSFFRLAFNKRFFDVAQRHGGVRYLLIKSYVSQSTLALGFLSAAGVMTLGSWGDRPSLQAAYLIAGLISLLYLYYRAPKVL